MSVSPEGGVVLVCDDDGKPRAAMAVDQDGGDVSTLDRWGSVTGMLP